MPIARRSETVATLIEGARRAARGEPAEFLRGKSVLVVDDEGRGLEHLAGMLMTVGGREVEVSTARTAAAALEICAGQAGRFDLVLLNYLLAPGCGTGIELLAELRRSGLCPRAKVILYSEAMNRGLEQRARSAGFDDTIHTDTLDGTMLRTLLARHLAATPPRRSE